MALAVLALVLAAVIGVSIGFPLGAWWMDRRQERFAVAEAGWRRLMQEHLEAHLRMTSGNHAPVPVDPERLMRDRDIQEIEDEIGR